MMSQKVNFNVWCNWFMCVMKSSSLSKPWVHVRKILSTNFFHSKVDLGMGKHICPQVLI